MQCLFQVRFARTLSPLSIFGVLLPPENAAKPFENQEKQIMSQNQTKTKEMPKGPMGAPNFLSFLQLLYGFPLFSFDVVTFFAFLGFQQVFLRCCLYVRRLVMTVGPSRASSTTASARIGAPGAAAGAPGAPPGAPPGPILGWV